MRDQLSQYVQLLFAGTTDTDDIKQEILQNTLDRYDDLINQGKAPEAAYRLAISGIGDINEILGQEHPVSPLPATPMLPQDNEPAHNSKLLRAIAIALYILSAIPIVFSDGSLLCVCLTVLIVAVATAIIVYAGKDKPEPVAPQTAPYPEKHKNPGRSIARGIIWGSTICLYISVSMNTNAWYITWLIFPMMACIQGIVTAVFDLKEANNQ
jgi:hypothetical protein